ncbi:MAG: hypothetical protein ACRES7_05025 [Gammaproteobacteria bacterium]
MRKAYSAKSVTLSRFPICFESLCKIVKYSEVNINKGYGGVLIEAAPLEFLKDLDSEEFPIKLSFKGDHTAQIVSFAFHDSIFFVDTEGFSETTSREVHRLIRESLNLTEPTGMDHRQFYSLPAISDLLWKVYDLVDEISKRQKLSTESNLNVMRCFVSFRFDDHSKALTFELKEFMGLVGLDFVSGLGFEPRSISEKVLERLSEPLNIFVILLGDSGDSAWLHQEIGVARGRKLPILVLKEEGAEIDSGMLGDTEFLSFPKNNISKAFVGILQALSYLNRAK